MVGIPRGRTPPLGFGIFHEADGRRKVDPDDIRFQILKRFPFRLGNDFTDLLNTLDRLGYHVQTEARKPIKDLEAYLAKVPLSFGINLFATHADR